MGAEGAVEIVFRKQVEEAEDPAAKKAELIAAYRKIIDVYIAARNDMIDDVIDPRETRPTIIRALEMAEGKRLERPWKRHRRGAGLSRHRAAPGLGAAARRCGAGSPAADGAQDREHDHRADDGAEDAAEVELVRVADAERPGEQRPADGKARRRCRR